jgi:hypothetical protein
MSQLASMLSHLGLILSHLRPGGTSRTDKQKLILSFYLVVSKQLFIFAVANQNK